MKEILARLIQIESSLRGVREDLIKEMGSSGSGSAGGSSPLNPTAADTPKLSDITPASWREWFIDPVLTDPTPVTPYYEFLPDLMVGYPAGRARPVRAEQQRIAGSDNKCTLDIWLTSNLEWFTVEFRIPMEVIDRLNSFHFAWTVTVDTSQRVGLTLYQRDRSGTEFRDRVDDLFIPSVTWTDMRKINVPKRSNVEETKIFFDFPVESFHSINFESVKLMAPAGSGE